MEALQSVNFHVYHPEEYRAVEESGILANVSGSSLNSDHIYSIIREIRTFHSFAMQTLIDLRPKDFNTEHFNLLVNLLCVPEAQTPPSVRRAFISMVINEWLPRKIDKPIALLPTHIPTDVSRVLQVNGIKFKDVRRNVKKIGDTQATNGRGDQRVSKNERSSRNKKKRKRREAMHVISAPLSGSESVPSSISSHQSEDGKIQREEVIEFRMKYPAIYKSFTGLLGHCPNAILKVGKTPRLTRLIQIMLTKDAPLDAFIMVIQIFLNHEVDLSLRDGQDKTAYDYVKEAVRTRREENFSEAKKLLSMITPENIVRPCYREARPTEVPILTEGTEISSTSSTTAISTERKGDFINSSELTALKTLNLSSIHPNEIISWCVSNDVHITVKKGKTPFLTSVLQKLICRNLSLQVFTIVTEAFIKHNVDTSLVDGASKTAYDYIMEMLVSRNEVNPADEQKLLSLLTHSRPVTPRIPTMNPFTEWQKQDHSSSMSLILPGFELFAKKEPGM